MIEDESNVEEQETVVEENPDFDASAFNDVDTLGEAKEATNEETETETDTEAQASEETVEESETESTDATDDNQESSWTTDIDDETEQSEETQEAATEEETTNEGWKQIAEDAGINAEDYDTFIDTLKNQQDLAQKGATNESLDNLKKFKSLDDEELMRQELKAKGYKDDEVEDEIDILVENGTIRSEARKVRKDIEVAIEQESSRVANSQSQADAKHEAEAEEARIELNEYMSKTSEMFGGKINDSQRDEHIEYISNGDFFDEIGESVDNVAQAAWLWKYRAQIEKAFRSNGFEKGKAKILDELVHPETNKSTRIPDPQTGEFNPTRFTDTETM
jgi:hypothetical protein